jgi:ParB family chromosome partitioning protein
MLEMALVENVQRVDLNALDRAKGFERLQSEFSLSTSEIAVRIGKSVAYVSNSLRLLTLPDALKDGLLSGLISEGHARALAAIDDNNLMVEAYKIILRESGSVRRAEELARRMKAKSNQSTKRIGVRREFLRVVSEELDKMQEEMEKNLASLAPQQTPSKKGNSTAVRIIRSRRETKVNMVFKGGLEETESRLQKIYKSLTS